MTDLTQAIAEGRETRMQVRRWFVETGWVDGNGIGLWYGTDESVEVSSRAVAEALRDEWLASGKIERDQWGNLRRTGPYGDFRIRSVWDDVPGELIQLADHKLAVAEAYRKAAGGCLAMSVRVAALDNDNYGDPREYAAGLLEAQHEDILAFADTDALAELQALRDERDRLDAVTNTLSEMWEGEQTARHSAEAELATLQRENAILRSNARAQGLVEEIDATGKSRRKETGNLARIITNQHAELRKQAGELATLRAAEKELSDAYLRIREKLGAWNTAHGGADRFAVTEAAVDALRAQVERLTAKLALVQRALEKADEGLEYMGLYAPALTEGAAP